MGCVITDGVDPARTEQANTRGIICGHDHISGPALERHSVQHPAQSGKAPGTVIFSLCGPFTARDMYGSLTPVGLRNMLNFQSAPAEELPLVNILDLTAIREN